MSLEEDTVITFDHILSRFNTYVETEGVDSEVHTFYSNILRANTVFPVQVAYLAAVHQLALTEAYLRRRQLRREELCRSKRFYSTVKCWVLEIRDLDVSRQLPGFEGSPSLTVRVTVEGQTKTTTKTNPPRLLDGTFEPVKVGQDVEFFAKRPTSSVHLDMIHINEEEADGSLERDVLIGTVAIPLRTLESQRTIRQWCKVLFQGECVAELKVRLHYNFKEDLMNKWAPEMGLARAPKEGGAEFAVGVIGVGTIGGNILDTLLRCNHFKPSQILASSRRPETLSAYEKLGVLCGSDNALVASRADVLIIAVQPNNLQQVASAVRGHIHSESMVISMVAGVTAERTAQMFRVPKVIRPQLGSETGLQVPDQKKVRRRKSVSMDGVAPGQVNPGQVNATLRREEERQAAIREIELSAHVQTASRALLGDPAAYQALVLQLAAPLASLGLSEEEAHRVANGGACDAMPSLRFYGEHQRLQDLAEGDQVLVMPGPAESEERPGVVQFKLPDERNEYLVQANGKDIRVKRNRLLLASGDDEEGFMLPDDTVIRTAEGWELATTFFKLVGEQAIGLKSRMPALEPTVSTFSHSPSHITSEKSQAWNSAPIAPNPEKTASGSAW